MIYLSTPNTYLIEYEIGLVLSKTYKLKKLNHLPHRDNLTPYYEQSIRILTKYKIALEELQAGKIKPSYKRLNATPQDHNSKPVNHRIVLAKIFTYISNREKKEKQRIDPTFINIIQKTKHRLADILQNLV